MRVPFIIFYGFLRTLKVNQVKVFYVTFPSQNQPLIKKISGVKSFCDRSDVLT